MELKPGVVNLEDGRLVEPREHLSEGWRSLQFVELASAERRELVSETVEHTLYVISGAGTAEPKGEGETIVLEHGVALTAPMGAWLEIEAGNDGLAYFHAVLAVGN
jgi:mannose-6-phosphate isomerase-like protein (cupin superfamily)